MTGSALEACELNKLIPTSDDLLPEFRERESTTYELNPVPILLCGCGTYFNPANYTHTQCKQCEDRYEPKRIRQKNWRMRRVERGRG